MDEVYMDWYKMNSRIFHMFIDQGILLMKYLE